MNDELDHIISAMRNPATSDELAGESAVVDRMYHAHESKGPTMFTSRRTRVATLIAAGALGFGSVAAAGPAAMDLLTEDEPPEEVSLPADTEQEPIEKPEEAPVEEEVPAEDELPGEEVAPAEEPVPEEADEGVAAADVDVAAEAVEDDPESMPELLDDPATDFFDESQCLPGNHGKTVSAVARGDFEYYERDEETGELTETEVEVAVRDAARSSCGKDFEGVDPTEEEPVEDETAEAEELEIEEIDEPEEPKGPPAHAGGKDKDKDKGKPAHAGGPPAHAGGKGKGGRG